MKVLELFAGTGSIGKVCKKIGWEVVSLDIDGRSDITIDILKWDYKNCGHHNFDIIWASCPCDQYSCMNFCRPEKIPDIDSANALVLKTLEIIKYFNPTYWYIENPQTSTLKKQPFMCDLPFVDFDYCMFGWYFRKRTRIWTNRASELNSLLCDKKCGKIKDGKHLSFRYLNIKGVNRLDLRHMIPEDLVFYLLLG